ncbi:rRNA pseudouridine synthase [Candidatus Gracilibacteria bacterium]|nr:rRNA pseudouridine synthase [Candidatus Gracilibacteria bacterium]
METIEKIKIHKYLSKSGVCSLRKAEEYIKNKEVFVNGELAHIGQLIDPKNDKVELGQKAVEEQKKLVYFKINKPRGIVTTCAQNDEQNIVDIIDIKQRVFPIGRLDKDTTGLLILTNDGRLANYLMHPRYNHQKEYVVETFGPISDSQLEKMRNGIFILGSYTKKALIKRLSSGTFSIIISEGKNRQIRRMVESVGNEVKKLKRIRIENIELGNLDFGEYKELTKNEKNELFKRLGLEL